MNCGPNVGSVDQHRRQRHHRPAIVPNVELSDLIGRASLLALGLHEHAPLPPETIELIHVEAAKERLHRLIDVADRNALPDDLVAVDVGVDLRHRGGEGRRHARQLGPLSGSGQERLQVVVQEVDRATAAILQPEREAALAAEAGNRRRHDRERHGFRHGPAQLPVQSIDDGARVERRVVTVLPRIELDEVERVVARGHAGQQAEADDGVEVSDALGLLQDRVHLVRHSIGSLEGSRRRQLDVEQRIAVVFFRQEARRQPLPEQTGGHGEQHQHADANQRLADQAVAQADVAVRGPREPAVERIEEPSEPARACGAERAAAWPTSAGESVSALNAEMSTETAMVIANCLFSRPWMPLMTPTGMKTAARISAMPMTGPDDLLHRLQGGIARAHALLDVVLHRFDDDDRVVHDQSDRQHQAEE